MSHSIRTILFSTIATACLLPSVGTAAPIVVGPGLGSATTTQHAFQPDFDAWFLADLSDPVTPAPLQVVTGSVGGFWTQELTFNVGFPNLDTGDTFTVQGLLELGSGDFALQNWTQEIVTPGWKWVESTIFDNDTAAELPGLQVSTSDSVVGHTFFGVAPGTNLFVVGTLEYTGAGGPPTAPIVLRASAIPEPGSALMLTLAIAGFALRRVRRLEPRTVSTPATR